MSYKLPDGTEIDCTLVQARRVWEICVTRDCSRVMPSSVGVEVGVPGYPDEPYLVLSDGRVFNLDLHFQAPPPPMESEKPPEVSEFHRGVITAIETIWKRKFATTHWTWEVQDILARAAADGKINGLATLLEMIATTDMVEDALDVLRKLRPTQPKPATEFTLNYCRGKLDAIKVVWMGRFKTSLPQQDLDTLIGAMQKDATRVDRLLKFLAGSVMPEVIQDELKRLKSGA